MKQIDYALNEEVLRHISYLEFQSKMTYLLDHKIYPLDKEGKLIKMFTMASKDLEREYHITLEELITNYRSKKILIKKNSKGLRSLIFDLKCNLDYLKFFKFVKILLGCEFYETTKY